MQLQFAAGPTQYSCAPCRIRRVLARVGATRGGPHVNRADNATRVEGGRGLGPHLVELDLDGQVTKIASPARGARGEALVMKNRSGASTIRTSYLCPACGMRSRRSPSRPFPRPRRSPSSGRQENHPEGSDAERDAPTDHDRRGQSCDPPQHVHRDVAAERLGIGPNGPRRRQRRPCAPPIDRSRFGLAWLGCARSATATSPPATGEGALLRCVTTRAAPASRSAGLQYSTVIVRSG